MGKLTTAEFDAKHLALFGSPRIFVRSYGLVGLGPSATEAAFSRDFATGEIQIPPTEFSDDLNRLDSATLGSKWVESESHADVFQIVSNRLLIEADDNAVALGSVELKGFAYWDGAYSDSPQFSELVFAANVFECGGGQEVGIGPAVRINASGTFSSASMYIAAYVKQPGVIRLVKFVNQDLNAEGTILGSHIVALVAGDRLKVEVQGTTLKVLLNGVIVIGPISDAALTTGKAGVGAYLVQAGDGDCFVSSWESWLGGTLRVPTKLLHLKRIDGNTQTAQPERGASTIGQFTIHLQDDDDEITRYMSNPKRRLGVTMTPTDPPNGGEIQAANGEDISGYPNAGALVFRLPTGYGEMGYGVGGYGGGNPEIVTYTSRDPATGKFAGITRGAFGTTPVSHFAGDPMHNFEEIRPGIRAQVFVGYEGLDESKFLALHKMQVYERRLSDDGTTWEVVIADIQRSAKKRIFPSATQQKPIILYGNKVTIALKVLLTTSQGGNSKYDRGDGEGLGIPQSLVDIAGLEALAEQFPQNYRFVESGPQDGKTWLEEQIWKTLNCYPAILPDGKYSAIRYAPAPAPGTQPLIADNNTVGLPRYRPGDRLIINVVEIWYDWDHVNSTFMTRQIYEEKASIDKYGRQPPLVIEDRGLASDLGAQEIADDRANRVFERYADPPPVIEVAGWWDHLVRDVGDIVRATFPRLPDLRTGLRGIANEVMEVTDIVPTFPFHPGSAALVRMTLLDIGAVTAPATATGIISFPVAIPTPTRYLVEAIAPPNDALKAKYENALSLWGRPYKSSGLSNAGVWRREAFSHKIAPTPGTTVTF